jgi:hypothetical protein
VSRSPNNPEKRQGGVPSSSPYPPMCPTHNPPPDPMYLTYDFHAVDMGFGPKVRVRGRACAPPLKGHSAARVLAMPETAGAIGRFAGDSALGTVLRCLTRETRAVLTPVFGHPVWRSLWLTRGIAMSPCVAPPVPHRVLGLQTMDDDVIIVCRTGDGRYRVTGGTSGGPAPRGAVVTVTWTPSGAAVVLDGRPLQLRGFGSPHL